MVLCKFLYGWVMLCSRQELSSWKKYNSRSTIISITIQHFIPFFMARHCYCTLVQVCIRILVFFFVKQDSLCKKIWNKLWFKVDKWQMMENLFVPFLSVQRRKAIQNDRFILNFLTRCCGFFFFGLFLLLTMTLDVHIWCGMESISKCGLWCYELETYLCNINWARKKDHTLLSKKT